MPEEGGGVGGVASERSQILSVLRSDVGTRSTLPYPVALAVKERLGLLVHLFICLGLGDTGVECRGICVDLPSVSVLFSVIRDVDHYYFQKLRTILTSYLGS